MSKNDEMTGVAAAAYMSRFVNTYGTEKHKQFVYELAHDHPTLQQSMVRLVVEYLRAIAKNPPNGRNEAAVRAAKIMTEALDEAGASALPLI